VKGDDRAPAVVEVVIDLGVSETVDSTADDELIAAGAVDVAFDVVVTGVDEVLNMSGGSKTKRGGVGDDL